MKDKRFMFVDAGPDAGKFRDDYKPILNGFINTDTGHLSYGDEHRYMDADIMVNTANDLNDENLELKDDISFLFKIMTQNSMGYVKDKKERDRLLHISRKIQW